MALATGSRLQGSGFRFVGFRGSAWGSSLQFASKQVSSCAVSSILKQAPRIPPRLLEVLGFNTLSGRRSKIYGSLSGCNPYSMHVHDFRLP